MSAVAPTDDRYSVFVIAVDDLEWTKHWLGRLRCDEIIVSVARRPDITPKVRIRAVESKATSKVEPVEVSVALEPFAEGIGQVVATLEALWRIIAPTGSNVLVEDLRFSSFIEHLASVALSSLHPLLVTDVGSQHVLRSISALSSREIVPPEDVYLDGAVVCTQYRAAVTFESMQEEIDGETRPWQIHLIRAGANELDHLLGPEIVEQLVKAGDVESSDEATIDEKTAPEEDALSDKEEIPDTTLVASDTTAIKVSEPALPPDTVATKGESAEAGARLARDLYLACLHRGFPFESPDPDKVVVAPALFSVSMALQAGASIRPIEAALDDLAREVGVPSVYVENDPERPFHLRFLIGRRDREFPSLPEATAPLFERDSQSYVGVYLGRTLDGRDYNSFVSSWPHMLIGGTTGSGKTTFIRSLLRQLNRIDADHLKIVIVDGKGEIDYFNVLDPKHFVPKFPEVVLGHQQVMPVFEWLVTEEIPSRREAILARAKANPNERPRSARELYVDRLSNASEDGFPPLIVVVDEFAELMLAKGGSSQQFEQLVQQVTQVGRSVLVHLILATQRPDSSVVSGAVKANLDARVALRLPTFHDSMTILGSKGAERLTGRGDLLFQTAGQIIERLQGYNE